MSWLLEYFDAWNRFDGEAVASYMADDVVYEDVALRHRVQGRDAILEFVRQSQETTPDAVMEVTAHSAGDDHYQVEWTWQPLGIRGVSVGRLRDGKIVENRDYWDRSRLKKAQAQASTP